MTRKHTKRKVWPKINPISYAMSGAQVAQENPHVSTWMATSHLSMKMLVEGRATKQDLQHITSAHNMVAAFMAQGFAEPHERDMDASSDALDSIAKRAVAKGKLLGTGRELSALNFMFQLHDALLATVSVAEFNRAVAHVNGKLHSGKSNKLELGAIA